MVLVSFVIDKVIGKNYNSQTSGIALELESCRVNPPLATHPYSII